MSEYSQQGESSSEKSENGLTKSGGRRAGKPSISSHDDMEAIERASTQEEYEDPEETHEKPSSQHQSEGQSRSLELKRTASKTLERVFTTRSITDPGPPPDGGFKAWSQVACAWVVIASSWGYINSYGAFQTYYTLNLDVSPSTISWIGTIQNWLTFFIGAFSGRALDAGLFVPTFIIGAVIQLIGIFLMSVSTKYYQLLLTQGVLTGLGAGIFFTPSMGLLATYFSDHRAFALGIASTGNAVGGIIYPIIVKELIPKIGFAWTTRVIGFVNMTFLCVAMAFLRPRLPPRKSGPLIEWSAFKEAPYAFLVAGLFFVIWTVYYTFYYIASYGVDVTGLNLSDATTLVVVISAVGIPARVIPPFFADKIGQLNIIVPTMFCLVVISYSWLAVSTVAGLYVFTAFFGVASATFQCLIPSTVAALTPDLNKVGTRLGMAFSCLSFAALTGPPIGGALQGAMGGSYTGASIWSATSVLISACLIGSARVAKVGWKVKVKT